MVGAVAGPPATAPHTYPTSARVDRFDTWWCRRLGTVDVLVDLNGRLT
jgi:hypothetical protein